MPGIFKNKFFTGKQKPFDAIHHLCTVKFLDNSDAISFTYEKNTKGRFLIDHVCSSINLIEKDYFGLKYTDAEKQECWLDPEKPIHSQIKGITNPVLYFQVRFYPSDLDYIREEITRYQLFLQVRKDFNEERLICNLQEALLLSSYAVQDELGDFKDLNDWHDEFVTIKLPPGMIGYEDYILTLYQELRGMDQNRVEYKFIEKAASLNSYGIDPYIVSDDEGCQMYLCVAPKGLIIFEDNLPTKIFEWNNILKLSFEGKSFHIKLNEKEKFTGRKPLKSHLNTSLFTCTGSNKKPQLQQTAISYKCLSHASCKQLWKNSVAYKYFYTLQSSSEAPKILSSGGFFARSSKFRYSGSCLAEIRKSSSSINREEPRFIRRLSSSQVDEESRFSTLPRKWKPNQSLPEDAFDTSHNILEVKDVTEDNTSDSAVGTTPAKSDIKTPTLLHDTDFVAYDKLERNDPVEHSNGLPPSVGFLNVTHPKVKDIELEKDLKMENYDVGSYDDIDGMLERSAISSIMKRAVNGKLPAFCSPVELATFKMSADSSVPVKSTLLPNAIPKDRTEHSKMTYNYPDVDASIDTTRDESSDMPSEEGSLQEVQSNNKTTKHKRQESGSGYDTGYMSSSSERMSRSFESEELKDLNTSMRSNGILEEMDFPSTEDILSSDSILNDFYEKIGSEVASNFTESRDLPINEERSMMREDLLDLLSYGSEDLIKFNKDLLPDNKETGELDGEDGNGGCLTPTPTPIDGFPSSVLHSFPNISKRLNIETLAPEINLSWPFPSDHVTSPDSGNSLMSGVFSAENFKRIKEIEQMIEENKNKIQLMKDAICSEIKKSLHGNMTVPADPIEVRSLHSSSLPYFKQPKHVSFSSHHTEWHGDDQLDQSLSNLKSWSGMEAINRNLDNFTGIDGVCEAVEFSASNQEEFVPEIDPKRYLRNRSNEFVEKVPFKPSDGLFVNKAEIYRCSDDSQDVTPNEGDDEVSLSESQGEITWSRWSDSKENTMSEGLVGSGSSSSWKINAKKVPTIETKHEQFTFSETVEEIVKMSPDVLKSLSSVEHILPSTNFRSVHAAPNSNEVVLQETPHGLSSPNASNWMIKNTIAQTPPAEQRCTSTKESFLTSSNKDKISHNLSQDINTSRDSMKSFFKGVGLTLLSVAISLLLFASILVIAFELNKEIPYVTDQQAVMELKRSIYEPAREQVMKLFKN